MREGGRRAIEGCPEENNTVVGTKLVVVERSQGGTFLARIVPFPKRVGAALGKAGQRKHEEPLAPAK